MTAGTSERRSRILDRRNRAWRELALARHLSRRAIQRARIELLVLAPLLVAILIVYANSDRVVGPGWDPLIREVTAVALIVLGWQVARDAGRALSPALFNRMDAGRAGTVSFLVRLAMLIVAAVIALRIAGLTPRALALGGALTAVVVGLAAQQTLGNVFAGTVLLTARPFRVGDRVRLQGGGLAGTVEGVVSSLGLLHTTLACGEDAIMVPNSVVIAVAIVPLREPAGIELRARLRPGVTPADVEQVLRDAISTPIRSSPRVTLEEVDGDEVVVQIAATPEVPADGPHLATEVLRALASLTPRAVA